MGFASICNRLSLREMEVLSQIVAGGRQKQIARDLGISQRTVEAHRLNIGRKLGARNVADVIRIALRGA